MACNAADCGEVGGEGVKERQEEDERKFGQGTIVETNRESAHAYTAACLCGSRPRRRRRSERRSTGDSEWSWRRKGRRGCTSRESGSWRREAARRSFSWCSRASSTRHVLARVHGRWRTLMCVYVAAVAVYVGSGIRLREFRGCLHYHALVSGWLRGDDLCLLEACASCAVRSQEVDATDRRRDSGAERAFVGVLFPGDVLCAGAFLARIPQVSPAETTTATTGWREHRTRNG